MHVDILTICSFLFLSKLVDLMPGNTTVETIERRIDGRYRLAGSITGAKRRLFLRVVLE